MPRAVPCWRACRCSGSIPGSNLGYAGGVNLGVARSTAELILLMNPDVLVLPGCVPALLDSLRGGAAVAGPRFYWDRTRRLVQPPSELRARREELITLLAACGPRWAARARRRWRRHARRHWEARAPLPSYSLSGSLLALRRSAWDEVGPFDEGFRLYFEETDWLLRAQAQGPSGPLRAGGRSGAPLQPERGPGAPGAAVVRGVGGTLPAEALRGVVHEGAPRTGTDGYTDGHGQALPLPAEGLRLPSETAAYPLWVEVSPNPTGFPAAAELVSEPLGGPWRLPAEIEERVGTALSFKVTDRAGREIAG